ncbi:MAG TPA: hydrogen peroxide-inducible genes activator [Gammaproteobacteria bacterium]|nr:hydrogen peroxide-inducible genes activator [Gammaproteobacteria bacterium]
MHLPSVRQLQYLLAVVELRHFGKAAERCFVTQSTLSTGIQELENMLGACLLERTKRKVIPTALGLEIADKARQVLLTSSQILELANSQQPPMIGKLKLGVIPTIAPFLLPKVLPALRTQFPALELFLIEDQSAHLLQRLDFGEIDCAIFALPYELNKYECQRFFQEDFYVAFPVNHPLSQGGPICSDELPVEELLMLEDGHCFKDHALSACHFSGLVQKAAFQGTSLYTLIEMVAGNQGITFLPAMAIDSSLTQQARISLRPLAETGPHREIGLVWRPTFHRKRDLQLLTDFMASELTAAQN